MEMRSNGGMRFSLRSVFLLVLLVGVAVGSYRLGRVRGFHMGFEVGFWAEGTEEPTTMFSM